MVIAIEHRFRLVAARLFLIRLLAFGVGDASVLQAVQRESLLARDHFGVHGGVEELTGFDVLQHWSFAHDRMQPWHTKHLVCIGDAAHAFDPQLGVGANMALADAITLAAVLHHATPPQVPHALASYRAARESQLRTYDKASRIISTLSESDRAFGAAANRVASGFGSSCHSSDAEWSLQYAVTQDSTHRFHIVD